MESLVRDFWFGLRMLRKNPGFSVVAALILALGIGANTAIFSLINSALLKPPPGDHPEQLVSIFWGDSQGRGLSNHSYADYLDYRKAARDVLSGVAAYTTLPVNLISAEGSERINAGLVSDNYFSVCGIKPLFGRTFLPNENTRPGASFTAIISGGLWRRRFGVASDLRGKTIRLNDANYEVIGVVPDRMSRMADIVKIDVYVPAVMEGVLGGDGDFLSKRQNKEFMVVGRIRAGVPVSQVKARFSLIAAELQKIYPEDWTENGHTRPLSVVPYSAVPFELRGLVIGFAGLLVGGVAVVLLIACNNLANFLLARAILRKPEVVMRLALGASRWRIVQQLLMENLTLSVIAGTFGLFAALWLKGLLTRFTPRIGVPIVIDLSLDYRVLLFNVFVTLGTALAFGLAPALQALKGEASDALKETSQAARRTGRRFRNLLLVAQTAFSLMLLMCAGTFLSGFMKVQSMDLGFNSRNVALLSVNPMLQGYSREQTREFLEKAFDRLKGVAGVESVSVATKVPMGLSSVRDGISPYLTGAPTQRQIFAGANRVSTDYFQTMRIPILRGRGFSLGDAAPGEAVINAALAQKFWPNEDAIGKFVRSGDGRIRQVVGVVATGKYDSLAENDAPFFYVPLEQSGYNSDLTFHVRTRVPPTGILDELRRQLLGLNPTLTVFEVESMEDHLAQSALPLRMGALLLGMFGALAIALASIGLYGISAYLVRQRTYEMGIRMALGASPRDTLRLVLGECMKVVAVGLGIGSAAGSALSAVVASQLYGIGSTDLLTLVIVVIAQFGIALLACWMGSRPLTRLEPVVTLRCQ